MNNTSNRNFRRIRTGIFITATFFLAWSGTVRAQIYALSDSGVGVYGTDGKFISNINITDFSPEFAVYGGDVFIADADPGGINEYGMDGSPVSTPLIGSSKFGRPIGNSGNGMVISGGDIYILNQVINGSPNTSELSEYGVDGSVVNQNLITGLNGTGEYNFAMAGNDFFISGPGIENVAEYGPGGSLITSGLLGAVDLSLISGIAISGDDLFLSLYNEGAIAEYDLNDNVLNASFISGLTHPGGLATGNGDLYVINNNGGSIGEYGLDGSTINASLITAGDDFTSLQVLPEPSAMALTGLGLILISRLLRKSAGK